MLKVQAFFYKIFEKFNNDLYLWKSEVATIKKGKIFNISFNIAHFSFLFFLTEPHIYLYNTPCKSHGFFYVLLWIWKHFKKCDFLKNFILSFFFRWGTHLFMSLFLSVCLSVFPPVAHHISGTIHHMILICGAHV